MICQLFFPHRLMMGAEDVEKSILSGTPIQSQADLNEFITKASAEKKAAVGKELGIEDWNTLTVQEFANKASAYRESGKAEAYVRKTENIKKMREIESSKARNIPRAIALADGAVAHYADADSDFAIARSGDTFTVYDYTTGNVTREMTRAEVNAELARYRERKSASTVQERATSETADATSENLSSASENYKKRLSTWDGKTEGFSFVLGDTSSVLADVVVNGKKIGNKQIRLDATKAKRILKDHPEMDIDVLKSLPEITEDPILVLESKTQSGRIVLFGDITAKNGKPVMVALELNPTTRSGNTYLDIIKIASAYTRTNTQNLIDTSDIKYVDKKRDRVSNWLKVNRLQLPLPSQQNASVTNSIPDSAEKVNTSDEKNTKKAFESELSEEKAAPTVKQIKEAAEARRQDAEIEALAKEKIKDYEDLSKPNQSMIRKVLREARAKGLSDADALSYARVSARSGLDITFDKMACYKGKNEAGEDVYHAGYYDPENNRIVVNPETKRKHASLLIHELSHAIRAYLGNDGKRHYKAGIDDVTKISDEMWEKINADYGDGTISEMQTELRIDEASAYYAEQMLGTDAAIELLLGETPTLRQKILSFFKQSARDYSTDAELSREARRLLRDYKALFDRFSARNQGRNVESGNAKDRKGRRFAAEDANKITAGMSEGERATILKSKRIKPAEIQQAEYAGFDWEALERNRKSAVEKPLIKKLREFGHLRTYKTDSIDVEFEFTAGGLRKSMNSQVSDYGGTLADLAKVVVNMQEILDSSVLLEIHKDKAKGTDRENPQLVQTYVLLSAFFEGNSITPVQFEVKQFIDDQNRLYLAVALTKINKTGVMDDTITEKKRLSTRLLPVSDYSISDFIKKINPSDENFFKYIPDELLTDEQKKAKQNAIAKENAKYCRFAMDSDYMAAVNRGDMVTAQRMVDEAAKAKMPNSKITNSDGSLRKVYHGTNTGEFTVFNPDYIGMSSGDDGFFGKGFYFAYSESEAKYYGKKRVVSAYLNIENPFNFQTQMQTFDGKRAVSGRAPDAVAFLNFAEKFPKLAENAFVTVFEGDQGRDISLIDFAKAFRDVLENKIFEYQTAKNEFGEKETIALADKKEYSYEYNGKTETYYDYDFQQRFYGEANEIDVAYEYLSNVVYKHIDMYSRTRLILDKNDEFTQALKNMGYDGTIQSVEGDEAVAFYPEQIKSADPVTYDDNGNVIPLSERFNPKKSDIRYSMEDIDPAKMGEPKLPRTAGTMSTGQHKKRIADLTKAKSYFKDQIYDIVKKLPMADMAMEKTREQVAEAIWQIYNEQLTANERREAAHDIAQFLVARLLTEAKTENPDAAEANEAMAYLRTGIGRLAFSEADRAELLHNLDKDGLRRILGRWGFKGKRNADGTLQGVRTPMEVFVTDIAREMPGMDLHRFVTIHMP